MQSSAMTIADARRQFNRSLRRNGYAECEICESVHKTYQRKLSSRTINCLHLIAKSKDGMTTKQLVNQLRAKAGREQHWLKYWGLATYGTDKKWRITEKGREFIKGKIAIPRYAYVRHGVVTGYSTETITIKDFA